MTVKQAQEINQKFLDLRDSINSLGKTVDVKKVVIDSLKVEKQKVDTSLNVTSEKLSVSTKQAEAEDKKHWREKRTWAGWMFFSFAVTVMLGFLK